MKENAGTSLELVSMKEKATNLQDTNPYFNFSHKLLKSVWMSNGQDLAPDDDGAVMSYYAAHHTQERASGYYGLVATMDVYGHNLNVDQLTMGAIWIINSNGHVSNVNAITVGWLVWPSHFNDSRTYLFTEWIDSNGQTKGCMNGDCNPGFQFVSGSPIFPGDVLDPVSQPNNARQNLTIKVFKEKSMGYWWVHCGFNSDPVPVGFFRGTLFDSLSSKATKILVGGYTTKYKKDVPSPPMGSGASASSDTRKAALVRDIQFIDEDGNSTPIGDDDMLATIVDNRLYFALPIAGGQFSYGGPGGYA